MEGDVVPLPSHFAFDTETDRFEEGIRTCLIQICPMNATGLKDVRMFEGIDCYSQFFGLFEETGYRMTCHVCNLRYEFSWMQHYLSENYEYVRFRPNGRFKPGQWSVSADAMSTYAIRICNHLGVEMWITDDLKRLGNTSVEKAGEGCRVEHPEWFKGMEKVKEKVDYNNGWSDPEHPDHEKFMHYSRQDGYTQAMIMRWVFEQGLDRNFTSASNGFNTALLMRYRDKSLTTADGKDKKFSRADFQKHYPPLDREMQDMVETSLLGGFTYGETGTHTGVFTHIDYSSSYPYEYAFGNLGRGRVGRTEPGTKSYDYFRGNDDYIRWYVVSFDFKYRYGAGMPSITGSECKTEFDNMAGRCNKKMIVGHISRKLFTETYLEELRYSYDLEDFTIHEMWYQKRSVGDFRPFIEMCYNEKSEAPKDSLKRSLAKLNMNGGIHGKTITKTHRTEKTYYNGEEAIERIVTQPQFQSLIGFTAMMNARERLLRDCRIVQEAGYKVMMCDTDSMVVNTTEANLRRVLGDKISEETGTMQDLGKFEFERDKVRKQSEFEEFRCWGLKRYVEVMHIDGERVYRKSAFAGMKGDKQKMLMECKTDGTEYRWKQLGAKKTDYGSTIVDCTKTMRAENIWDEPIIVPDLSKPKGLNITDIERVIDLNRSKRQVI